MHRRVAVPKRGPTVALARSPNDSASGWKRSFVRSSSWPAYVAHAAKKITAAMPHTQPSAATACGSESTPAPITSPAMLTAAWNTPDFCTPLEALSALAEEPWALGLLSGGGGRRGRWSYVAARPTRTLTVRSGEPSDPFAALAALIPEGERLEAGPPFQGGVAGLAAYELGAKAQDLALPAHPDWPDLACALYPAVLAFDHERRELRAIGRGETPEAALSRARALLAASEGASGTRRSGPLTQAALRASDPARSEDGDAGADLGTAAQDISVRVDAGRARIACILHLEGRLRTLLHDRSGPVKGSLRPEHLRKELVVIAARVVQLTFIQECDSGPPR